MSIANYNFKLLSLNARGIRDFHKRKAIFTWIKKQKVDIAFLQETYSSREIENQWKFQWLGKMLFSHGTTHSKGVLILFSSDLQIDIKNVQGDSEGRYIFVEALVQGTPFLFVNLYAPTESGRRARFQTSNFIGPYNLHRLLLSGLGLLFRSLPIVLLDQS